MSNEAINDSLKNVAKAQEIVRLYIKETISGDPIDNEVKLLEIERLLTETVDILSSKCST